MPQKKSRRVASRQAAASKERKKKKRAQAAQQRAKVPTAAGPEPVETAPSEPVSPTVTQPPRETVQIYRSVTTDLRKIGIIAGPMIVVLIILGFVL